VLPAVGAATTVSLLASISNPVQNFSESVLTIVSDPTFGLRCFISGIIACALYIGFGLYIHHYYPRDVGRKVFDWSLKADFPLAIVSLVVGSPLIQAFGVAHDKWGIMKTYTQVDEYGWAWYFLQIPVYLFLWDLTFFTFHFLLHFEPFYSMSHAHHHAFRPPCAWSGIAIDPFETLFNGLAPYLVPLFILPFHVYTVYVINVLLVGWALLLHSSSEWKGNWLFVGTDTHNMHHSMGIRNGNYGAIFKIFDRICGTLVDEQKLPYWMENEKREREEQKRVAQQTQLHAKSPSTATAKSRATKAGVAISKRVSRNAAQVVSPVDEDDDDLSCTSASDLDDNDHSN
jgi:sterol desaturase/sphingolipid hydroxylase (fatty acid hydroxylase superfamily)